MENKDVKKYAGIVMAAMLLILVMNGYDYDTARNILANEDVVAYVISIVSAVVWGVAHAYSLLGTSNENDEK